MPIILEGYRPEVKVFPRASIDDGRELFYCEGVKRIESSDNPLVRHIGRLMRDGRYRREHGEFVVEGYRVFDSASGVRTVVLRDGAAMPPRGGEAASAVCLAAKVFDGLSDTRTSQGILAICSIPGPGVLPPEGRYVYLDGLQDPGNVGTIIRAAAGFGLDGVVCGKGTADPFAPKAARASAGAVFRLAVLHDGGPEFLRGRRAIAAEAGGTPLPGFDPPGDFVLVVGNEGGGISPEAVGFCAERVAVPMPGGTESLNAAVSACIVLYAFIVGGTGRG